MEPTRWMTAWALVSMVAAGARGQHAAVVQLPTYSHFSTSTTVSVPDRGGAWLGGVGRAASGSQVLGGPRSPFSPQGSGGNRGAAGMGVAATVHDFEAMENQLFQQAASKSVPGPRANPWQGRLKKAAASSAGRPAPSIAAIQVMRAESLGSASRDAADWYDRGCRAEEAGNAGAAKVYFRMAARRAAGPARAAILAHLDRLGGTRADRGDQAKP